MKVPYLYLKKFLGSSDSQKKLAEIYTQVGFECEIDGPLIDFDITPNRGDVLSLRGLAREYSAFHSRPLKENISYSQLDFKKDKSVINSIDQSGCMNYHLMIIKGLGAIKKLDSSKADFLQKSGVPLIHPLVDLGNYVMLELGTPMHVFDFKKLHLPINVMFPKKNNLLFDVIGGDQKSVQSSSLVVQDQSGIQAIAGVIGGQESAVSKNTSDIAVEAAFFYPEKIMNQARKYGLATDASHRFERGVDPSIQKRALERFLFLLKEISEFDSAECFLEGSQQCKRNSVRLNVDRFNSFSGLKLTTSKVKNLLHNLGFGLIAAKDKSLNFSVPSHRFDVKIEEDLFEELLRCFGYDNIPFTLPKAGPINLARQSELIPSIRSGLVYSGFKELMHLPFVSDKTYASLNGDSKKPAKLLNPINENEPNLRGSLFGAIFIALNENLKRGFTSMKVFESGNVFQKVGKAYQQEAHIAAITYHHEPQKNWTSHEFKYDFFSLKAEVLKLLTTLGIEDVLLKPSPSSKVFNQNSLAIFINTKQIGMMGEINLSATQKLLSKPAFGFELYPERMAVSTKSVKLRSVSKFPASTRDINIIIQKSHNYSDVESAFLKQKIKFLLSFELSNTFEGKSIPEGSISMTLRMVFQSNEKSLLESEITQSVDATIKMLNKALQAEIRS